jgi:uncharacterized integral membrane protein
MVVRAIGQWFSEQVIEPRRERIDLALAKLRDLVIFAVVVFFLAVLVIAVFAYGNQIDARVRYSIPQEIWWLLAAIFIFLVIVGLIPEAIHHAVEEAFKRRDKATEKKKIDPL